MQNSISATNTCNPSEIKIICFGRSDSIIAATDSINISQQIRCIKFRSFREYFVALQLFYNHPDGEQSKLKTIIKQTDFRNYQ